MNGHLIIGISTLALAAWVDLRTMRIPNRLLLLGSISHLVFWFLADEEIARPYFFLAFISLVSFAISIEKVRRSLVSSIGMGDLKLIAYLLLFVIPFLDPARWLISMTSVSIGGLILIIAISDDRRKAMQKAFPFAPILFLGTSLTLAGSTIS